MLRIALAAAAALALAPSPASADAVCSLQVDVRFDGKGGFSQTEGGDSTCVGNVGGVALDPGFANPTIGGVASGGGCAPVLESGSLVLRPRRALEMWSPEHLELSGDWRAVAGALSGTLITGGTAVSITGAIAFTGGCSDRGRLHVDLVLGNERPAPRQEPAAVEPEKAQPDRSQPAKRAKSRRKRSCRSAKSRRAAKRCRRARR